MAERAGLISGRLALGWLIGGEWRFHPARFVTTAVAIARALVHRPALILADEPTGNLDPETSARVLALFAEAVRGNGAAGVMVTHSEASAAIADRVLTLGADGLVERRG